MHSCQFGPAHLFTLSLCLLSSISPSAAIPSHTSHTSLTQAVDYSPSQAHVNPSTRSLTTLRDWVIETLWPVVDKHKPYPYGKGGSKTGLSVQQLGRYTEEVVLRFNVSNDDEARTLSEASSTLFLDVWAFADHWVDIRLRKSVIPSLFKILPRSLQSNHEPLLQGHQLAEAIKDSYPTTNQASRNNHAQIGRTTEDSMFFQDYRPYSVIVPWMRLLQSMYPSIVQIITIGTSAEGRDIMALRIGAMPTTPDPPVGPRKTILITGGQHAREWISTSTVNYVAWSLVMGYGKRRSIDRLLEQYDWVFVPTVNPDGYAYTWEVDRLWRKNRQQTSSRACIGVDLDRSWDFMWDGGSTSGNPCSESYAGEAAFDAVEARVLADWASDEVEKNNVEFVGLFDLHSYSQQILYPYSFSCSEKPPTMEDLEELGEGLAKAMRSNRGTRYTVASACEGNVAVSSQQETSSLFRMEIGGGSALDWFYHELHVRHAFQIKLRDKGSYGFLLPKQYIIPTGLEVLQALEYFGKSMLLNMQDSPSRLQDFGRRSKQQAMLEQDS